MTSVYSCQKMYPFPLLDFFRNNKISILYDVRKYLITPPSAKKGIKVDLKQNFLLITFKRVQTVRLFFQIHLHDHVELYFHLLLYSHHSFFHYALHPLLPHHFPSYFLLQCMTCDDIFCCNYSVVQVLVFATSFHQFCLSFFILYMD